MNPLSPDQATIDTQQGKLRLALREHQPILRKEWLGFDEHDCSRSRPILEKSRSLVPEVWLNYMHSGPLFAYLGSNPEDPTLWEEELAIELELSSISDDGQWYQWWASPRNRDVNTIRKVYWCAARATLTLCTAPHQPIKRKNGRIVSTKIELGYEGDFEKVYDAILRDMIGKHSPAHLSNPFERYLDFKDIHRAAEGSLAFELYKRLTAILPRYEEILRTIIHQPATQLIPQLEYHTYSTEESMQAIQHAELLTSVETIHALQQWNGYLFPTAFTSITAKQSRDNEANRFVAYSVYRVRALMDFVRQHLEQEEEQSQVSHTRHEHALDVMSQSSQRFLSYQHALPAFSPGAGLAIEAMASPVLSYDQRYATLQHLTQLLDQALRYIDESQIPFEVHAFQKVYEHWCFIKIVEALLEIGFTYDASEGLKSTLFYQHPIPNQINCTLKHPQLPRKRMEVWYDRSFEVLRNRTDSYDRKRPYGVEMRSRVLNPFIDFRAKNRPDIVLEIHEDNTTSSPSILTFDPTLRQPRSRLNSQTQDVEDKYHYQKLIRSFEQTDPRTRESLCLVKSSWGIWPGDLDNLDTITLDEEDYELGFIHLRPEADLLKALPKTLQKILIRADVLPA